MLLDRVVVTDGSAASIIACNGSGDFHSITELVLCSVASGLQWQPEVHFDKTSESFLPITLCQVSECSGERRPGNVRSMEGGEDAAAEVLVADHSILTIVLIVDWNGLSS